MSLNGIGNYIKAQVSQLTGNKKADAQPNKAQLTEQTTAADNRFTVDMSDLELKAEMNKALGLNLQATSAKGNVDYEKINKEFAADPFKFAQQHLSPEVREIALAESVDFDANATVLRTFTPERQEQVIAGFSQRNESPRAFTGEFLDMFVA